MPPKRKAAAVKPKADQERVNMPELEPEETENFPAEINNATVILSQAPPITDSEESDHMNTDSDRNVDTAESNEEEMTDDEDMADNEDKEEINSINQRAKGQLPTLTPYALLLEAVSSSTDKNGISINGIKIYMQKHYPEKDWDKYKIHLKKALIKAFDNGTIVRPKNSKVAPGLTGSFKLNKQQQANNETASGSIPKRKTTLVQQRPAAKTATAPKTTSAKNTNTASKPVAKTKKGEDEKETTAKRGAAKANDPKGAVAKRAASKPSPKSPKAPAKTAKAPAKSPKAGKKRL
ncbi:hypothetical protein SK128_024837 [Halocaridina rubra]|uniref:H15 domain-containing protein n=1 Tax=Halocaridina rubra TaxID=373956 RepID=A0AAN8WT16_HALRR